MMDWSRIRHFKPTEFDSPDAPGSGVGMNPDLIDKLEQIRDKYGRAMQVASGYRTPAHNQQVGGVDSSAHCDGDAVDIVVRSAQERFNLIVLALSVGISRIGIGRSFVHLDVSTKLPSPVMWTY